MIIQNEIRKSVESKLLSKKDFTELAGIDYVNFTKWLNGQDVGLSVLNRIMKALEDLNKPKN